MGAYNYSNAHPATLSEADMIDAATVSVVATAWTDVGIYTVGDHEALVLGQHNYGGQDSARGRLLMVMKDGESTPAVIPGEIRLIVRDANDGAGPELYRGNTVDLAAVSTSDRRTWAVLPVAENPVRLNPGRKLVLQMKSTASKTLTKANCTIIMHMTRWNVSIA